MPRIFDNIETKLLPALQETLNLSDRADANRTGGGIILFGLDESADFSVTGVGDAHRLQEEITNLASF